MYDGQVTVSPFLCRLVADRRLFFTGSHRVYRPLPRRSPAAVVVAALMLIGGVETNPGPGYDCISTTIPLTRHQSEPQDLKYSAESLKAFQHNIPPHRSIRKTLFQYHLWLPARHRTILYCQNSHLTQNQLSHARRDSRVWFLSTEVDSPTPVYPIPVLVKKRRSTARRHTVGLASRRTLTRVPVVPVTRDVNNTLLSCYTINARSLRKPKALQLLRAELDSLNIDIAAVTETWFNKTVSDQCVNIPGYCIVRCDRPGGRRCGGVCTYVRDIYSIRQIFTSMHVTGLNSGHEICWLHITTPKHTYLFSVLYHPPKPIYNSSLFIERLVADIDELACEYPDAIMFITGDFNRLNISQALTDTGLSQMVLDCTRGRHTLDLFITNRPHLVTCKAVQSCISTDHCALLTNSDKNKQSASIPRRTVDFYDIRQQHLSNLADFLHQHDWSSILHTTDINVAYDTFLHEAHTSIKKHNSCTQCHHYGLYTCPHHTTHQVSPKETQQIETKG